MIDVTTESIVDFPDAAQFIPGRPHIATIHRWRLRGIRGVRLETILVGGRRYTSREALARFFEATTTAQDKSLRESMRAGRISAQREREIAAAEAELDAAGI